MIVGSVTTGLYFVVREALTKKKTGRLSLSTGGSEETTTPGDSSSAWWGVVDVVVVVVLWVVGGSIAFNLGVPDTPSLFVGLLLPLGFLLVRRFRRSHSERLAEPGG